MDQDPKISIIIVHWNTPDYLINSIESILSGASSELIEIVVVDNASKLYPIDEMQVPPSVLLIKLPENVGFAAATNVGYRASRGEYVMTLNPDTLVAQSTIDRIVKFLDENDTAGIVAGKSVGDQITAKDFCFKSLYCRSFALRRLAAYRRTSLVAQRPNAVEVDYIIGTGYAIRRAAISDDRQLFSERNFLFGEEFDICTRIRKNGYKIFILPDAPVHHFGSVTFKYNEDRIKIIRELGTSVIWWIRREHLGDLGATIYGVRDILENGILAAAFSIRIAVFDRIFGRDNKARQRMYIHYRSIFAASLKSLILGDRFRSRMNQKARQYLQ